MTQRKALEWIVGNDTGISSKAIWARMMGVAEASQDHGWGNYPHDPDDFGRCYRLLKAVPEWRSRIGEMAAENTVWKAMADAWDELSAMYEAEVDTTGRRHSGLAPKMYERMKQIEDAASEETVNV